MRYSSRLLGYTQIAIVVIGIRKLVVLQQSIQVIVSMGARQKGRCAIADQIIGIGFSVRGSSTGLQPLERIIGMIPVL